MPKRDIQTISHSSATNHRIVARPDEPFPDVTFTQTTATLPDLIHLNAIPHSAATEDATPLPLLTLLLAYGELSESKPAYVSPYLQVLSQLEHTQPNDPTVQAALGRKDLKSGNLQSAVTHLKNALQSNPKVATTNADLADALAKQGQVEDAIPFVEKAVELDPFNPLHQKMLIVDLVTVKQYPRAHTALQHYLEIFPQDDFMRQMLARAEGKPTTP